MLNHLSIYILYILHLSDSISPPQLLLVSFDGFRYDYPTIYGPLDNFHRLNQQGVRVSEGIIPTFSTRSLSNHYSLVTGLYEESHGLISSNMYDPESETVFDVSSYWKDKNMRKVQWWNKSTIWMINEREGHDRRSGIINWPQYQQLPEKTLKLNDSLSFKQSIDEILKWFNDSKEPINFGAIYSSEPDTTGHLFGPYSKEVRDKVLECDELLGYLMSQIDNNTKLRDNLHVIVTSDHGMEPINENTKESRIVLTDYADTKMFEAYGDVVTINIFPHSVDDIDSIFENLKEIPHAKVYKKNDIPNRFHYKHNPRTGDLLIIMEAGFHLSYNTHLSNQNTNYGEHGYDNEVITMKAIFYGSGPQFKRNYTSTTLVNIVDIFPLMCHILNITSMECSSSNGSLNNLQDILNNISLLPTIRSGPDWVLSFIFLFGLMLVIIISVIWSITAWHTSNKSTNNDLHEKRTLLSSNSQP